MDKKVLKYILLVKKFLKTQKLIVIPTNSNKSNDTINNLFRFHVPYQANRSFVQKFTINGSIAKRTLPIRYTMQKRSTTRKIEKKVFIIYKFGVKLKINYYKTK
ncbi:hypothetical protein CAPN001_18700 [Capnocytophaga stomatis]|uniref:Uncharacterized protein n=2 Tax=Capnocytophaga TaxID=1016 RepID=A0A0B7HI76_9FLAO|nr:hypothetical protein CGC58_07600 [Capnocytophaga stomatis]CEN38965.1 hypothetical protein CCYN74_300004 [Capnocytophaga cynodegmi]CEN39069.1 hypothetical protein CCYN49044_280004 [Capnocytophaga cynodegmi]GIJ92883.1 hypothetical protein CAPN002_01010 [Capnocytophaga stomatis]GIJ97301.1 hypothetical protein CAPN001_18700 [Capnocytophaga stomatis]